MRWWKGIQGLHYALQGREECRIYRLFIQTQSIHDAISTHVPCTLRAYFRPCRMSLL